MHAHKERSDVTPFATWHDVVDDVHCVNQIRPGHMREVRRAEERANLECGPQIGSRSSPGTPTRGM